jgi:anti-sigma regulatory factor (Ser/Thr protein kinase)
MAADNHAACRRRYWSGYARLATLSDMKSEIPHEGAAADRNAVLTAPPASPVPPPPPPAAPRPLTVQLSSTPRGARLARHLAAEQLDTWGWPYDSDTSRDVVLLVGELAVNAIRHGRLPGRDFRLRVALDTCDTCDTCNTCATCDSHDSTGARDEHDVHDALTTPDGKTAPRLRIEVTDTRPDRRPPEPGSIKPPPPGAESGHGLLLVEALSDRWGVSQPDHFTKTVWCELDIAPTPLEVRERSALAAHRQRQARDEPAGVRHDDAFRRVFGEDGT